MFLFSFYWPCFLLSTVFCLQKSERRWSWCCCCGANDSLSGKLVWITRRGKQKAPKENWMFFSDTSDSNHFLLETKKKTIFPSVGKCNGGECRRKWTSCSSSALQIFPSSSSSSHFSLSFPPSPRFPRAVEFFSFCFENEFSFPSWTQTPSISIRIRRSSLPRLLITSTVLKQTKRKWGKSLDPSTLVCLPIDFHVHPSTLQFIILTFSLSLSSLT